MPQISVCSHVNEPVALHKGHSSQCDQPSAYFWCMLKLNQGLELQRFSFLRPNLPRQMELSNAHARTPNPHCHHRLAADHLRSDEDNFGSSHPLPPKITSTLADANRSGGPPKPGRRLLNGVRRCPRRSAGGPLGPDGPPESPWGRRGVPRGSVHQSCIDTGQSSDPSSPDGSRRAKTVFRRKPIGTRYGPTAPDEP